MTRPDLQPKSLPLGLLARRVADQLAGLADMSCEVQAALSLCAFDLHTDAKAIKGLQGIDRVTQTLADLAQVMQAVSVEIAPGPDVSTDVVMSGVKLRQLVLELAPTDAVAKAAVHQGEIDWF